MDSPERYKSSLSFIDLLFNILVGFVFLFIIAFILINPVAKKGDIKVPAEYLIILTWPEENKDDFDLWVMDPAGNKIGFTNREAGLLSLDRDDLGRTKDAVIVDGKEILVELNREVISIRGIIPGDYYVSVHYYKKNDVTVEVPVTVEVIKINPYYIVYNQTKIFNQSGQINNYYKFTLSEAGDFYGIEEPGRHAVGVTP